MVRKVLHDEALPRELFMYGLTRERGALLVNDEWQPKKIIIEGIIKGTSISELETNIDTFKKNLAGKNKILDVQYESGTRRYLATAQVIQIERDYYHLNYAPYSVAFMIPEGVGKATSASSVGTVSIERHTLEDVSFTADGTAVPKFSISLLFKLVNSVTSVSLTINGDQITVDEPISAGQTLVIDAENKRVTLDGVEKIYTGLFPRLQLGSNGYKIVIGSVSHQYDVTVTYTKAYL